MFSFLGVLIAASRCFPQLLSFRVHSSQCVNPWSSIWILSIQPEHLVKVLSGTYKTPYKNRMKWIRNKSIRLEESRTRQILTALRKQREMREDTFLRWGSEEDSLPAGKNGEEGMVTVRLCHSLQALVFLREGMGEGRRVHVNLVGRGLCIQFHRPSVAHPGLPHNSLTVLTLQREVGYSQSPQNPGHLAQDPASCPFFCFLSSLSSYSQHHLLFLLIAFWTFQTC